MNKGWKRIARMQLPKDEERFGFIPHANDRTRKLRDAFTLSLGKYEFLPSPQPTPNPAPLNPEP
jgi:hypothetical protein